MPRFDELVTSSGKELLEQNALQRERSRRPLSNALCTGCVAQWLVHLHDNLEVLGSIPGGG
jgi:hypothetical protein